MPKVGNKKFAYTAIGKAAARKAEAGTVITQAAAMERTKRRLTNLRANRAFMFSKASFEVSLILCPGLKRRLSGF